MHGQLNSKEEIKEEYSIEERNHLINQQLWGGYSRHNQIYKIKKANNIVVEEKLLVENHALMMYTPFISDQTEQK